MLPKRAKTYEIIRQKKLVKVGHLSNYPIDERL
jgi:hypothetical protein